MIISHLHKFIFFAIPKTGTHAVRFALRRHLELADEEQVQLFVQKALSYPEIAKLRHGHIRWSEIRDIIGASMWGEYFKFAFVRNPWERFVSYCAFMYRKSGQFEANPRATMTEVLDSEDHHRRIVFRPQHEFICDESGAIMLDFVGRHERMQLAYNEVCVRIGLPTSTLDRINASAHGPWRDYYDDNIRKRVCALYARDIEIFGYEFPD